MPTRSSIVVSAAVLVAMAATPLAAQRPDATATPAAAGAQRFRWGPQVSFETRGDAVGIGARFEYSLASLLSTPRVDGIFEANWFPGTVDVFDLTYNVVYRFQTPNLQPYAGGGLAFWLASGPGNPGSKLHLDAIGGLKFAPMGRVTPIVQLRYVFVQGDALIATAGILF